jgi:hypothetical protein
MTFALTGVRYADITVVMTLAHSPSISQSAALRGLSYGPYGSVDFDGFDVTLRVSCELDPDLRRDDALLTAGAAIGHTLGAAAVICNTRNRVLRTDTVRPLTITD